MCSELKFHDIPFFGRIWYYVFKPKGVLYSGNAMLYKMNNSMPIGKKYYDNDKGNTKKFSDLESIMANNIADEDVQYMVSTLPDQETDPSWYGAIDTAGLYSDQSSIMYNVPACEHGQCILSFRILNPLPLLNFSLNQDEGIETLYTLIKILTHLYYRDIARFANSVYTAFFYGSNKFTGSEALSDIKYLAKRHSTRVVDHYIVKMLREHYKNILPGIGELAGYCSAKYVFHEEFCLWNATKYLRRDYNNENDYQHNKQLMGISNKIKEWIYLLDNFQTYNVFIHTGNLLDHSNWCVFYAEDLVDEWDPQPLFFDKTQLRVVLSTAAFFHDVGKLVRTKNTIGTMKKQNYIAYWSGDTDKMKHGELGWLAFLNKVAIDFSGKRYHPEDVVRDIFNNEPYTDMITCICAWINLCHWDIGYINKNYPTQFFNKVVEAIKTTWVNNFLKTLSAMNLQFNNNDITKHVYHDAILILMIVSIADISAQKNYIEPDKSRKFKHRTSNIFPWLSNRGKVYPGSLNIISNIPIIEPILQNILPYLKSIIDGIHILEPIRWNPEDIEPMDWTPTVEPSPVEDMMDWTPVTYQQPQPIENPGEFPMAFSDDAMDWTSSVN
jgi:hypothetical protein